MKIRIYKTNTLFMRVCNSSEELFKTVESLYKEFNQKCFLYTLNKRFYIISKVAPNQEFFAVKYYIKGILEEYAKLLSVDAINEIGKKIKTS